jgi:hypothetical protein
MRLIFSKLNRNISLNIKPKDIIKNSFSVIQKRLKLIIGDQFSYDSNIDFDKPEDHVMEKIKSFPSKTAQNGLNFLTKEYENLIRTEVTPLHQSLFEIIYILILEKIPNENIADNLFNNLMPKYGVNSLSKSWKIFLKKFFF